MKKFITTAITTLIMATATITPVCADNTNSTDVYVTISDKDGRLAVTYEKITVTDADNDGTLTINDALYCAHEAKYDGGAAAGYSTSDTEWGTSLMKLWGTENGGSYGYYINNTSPMSLDDSIKEGDVINAFVYTDLTSWSDIFCYFDKNIASVEAGEEITFTLKGAGYDESYNPVTYPISDAIITINGVETEYTTDENGNVTFKADTSGLITVSAVSSDKTLVPPVALLEVTEPLSDPDAGVDNYSYVYVILMSICTLIIVIASRKKSYEA